MKAFLIIEDNPDVPGGIQVNVMHQPTQAEIDAGVNTRSTVAGMMAKEAYDHIHEIVDTANQLAANVRKRVEQRKPEQNQCLH
ncbi:hypothetical protein [Methylomonas sp. 11b]|uniref:hypothetical protein n=1 Tax=Methylomonas sp. 11b TaxID=1168169 RepID=UPI0004788F3C|nr:hypothetical protein [Methylomonas sp. 11b]